MKKSSFGFYRLQMWLMIKKSYLRKMNEAKTRWVKVYALKHFTLGITSTERTEPLIYKIKKYMRHHSSLVHLIKYLHDLEVEEAWVKNIRKEIFPLSEHLTLKIYPLLDNAHKKYSDYCFSMLKAEITQHLNYKILVGILKWELINKDKRKEAVVELESDAFTCTCMLPVNKGIPCKHILAVASEEISKPMKHVHINDRWLREIVVRLEGEDDYDSQSFDKDESKDINEKKNVRQIHLEEEDDDESMKAEDDSDLDTPKSEKPLTLSQFVKDPVEVRKPAIPVEARLQKDEPDLDDETLHDEVEESKKIDGIGKVEEDFSEEEFDDDSYKEELKLQKSLSEDESGFHDVKPEKEVKPPKILASARDESEGSIINEDKISEDLKENSDEEELLPVKKTTAQKQPKKVQEKEKEKGKTKQSRQIKKQQKPIKFPQEDQEAIIDTESRKEADPPEPGIEKTAKKRTKKSKDSEAKPKKKRSGESKRTSKKTEGKATKRSKKTQ